VSDKQSDNISGYNSALITRETNRAMFDSISGRYDLLNRIMTAGLDRKWRRLAVDQLRIAGGGEYIDAGCGTGDICIEILRRPVSGRIRVTGIDHSEAMLAKGRTKVEKLRNGHSASLICGDVTSLPIKDSTVDGVISGFVIRNICDRSKALSEWHRVIRPGGRCVILEPSIPENPVMLCLYKVFTRLLVTGAGALFSKYRAYAYLIDSINAFPPPKAFQDMLTSAGFRNVSSESLAFGVVRLYSGTKQA